MRVIKEVYNKPSGVLTNPVVNIEVRNQSFNFLSITAGDISSHIEVVIYKAGKKFQLIEKQSLSMLAAQQSYNLLGGLFSIQTDDISGLNQDTIDLYVGNIVLKDSDVMIITMSKTGASQSILGKLALVETELNVDKVLSYRITTLDAIQLKNVLSVVCYPSSNDDSILMKFGDYENEFFHFLPYLFQSEIPSNIYIEKTSSQPIHYVELINLPSFDVSRPFRKYSKIVNENELAKKMTKVGLLPSTIIKPSEHVNQDQS